ncbi:3-dehydroquinate synthase [soil metagenome]
MEQRALGPIQQVVDVSYRYTVSFTTNLFSLDNPVLAETCVPGVPGRIVKILVVVDAGVSSANPTLLDDIERYFQTYRETHQLVREPLLVPGGEQVKNDHRYVSEIQSAINEGGIDRHEYVVVVGGGAVLDMAGFAAATAHRGIRLIRVPTTVLSQNESGVGVKNGVNAFGKKNFLGSFSPPVAVINDFALLEKISDRDWRGGISEAVKVALLKDVAFFDFLEEHGDDLRNRDEASMRWLIYRCAELHLNHIATSGDPFEFGSSRPLDFGHWSAHKLEQISNYSWRHGEAVAIGIALDSTYSYLSGRLSKTEWQRIISVFQAVGLPVYASELEGSLADRSSSRCVLQGLNEFREHLGGELTIMLLDGIGRGIEVHEIDESLMIEAMALLRQLDNANSLEETHGIVREHVPAVSATAH